MTKHSPLGMGPCVETPGPNYQFMFLDGADYSECPAGTAVSEVDCVHALNYLTGQSLSDLSVGDW